MLLTASALVLTASALSSKSVVSRLVLNCMFASGGSEKRKLRKTPRGTSHQPQGEERTPIKQDVKKGKLRFYHSAIPWNYGLLPQTWEVS